MGGKSKRHNLCVRCGKPSYGNMCRKCRYEFRDENRSPNYRGGHRMVVCPGCGAPMSKDATLCCCCWRKYMATGLDIMLRPKAMELITVACHTCGVQFVAVKDWHDAPSHKRGLRGDEPDRFYCKDECYIGKEEDSTDIELCRHLG